MRIKILKSELIKATLSVQNVISSKSSLPILSNILIETDSNNIKLTSTDLEIGITATCPAEIEEQGAITVPAKRFSDIIKELPDEDILLNTLKNNSTTIKCGKCFFKILGLPKDDFPKLPEFNDDLYAKISQPVLKQMLSMTCFSISRDEARYVLTGALFLFKGNNLIIVTTDGKRLSLIKKGLEKEVAEKSIIVPSKTVHELNRVLKEEGDVKISISENQVRFEMENITIISRLIEGEFPNYEQVIPAPIKEKIIVHREDMLLAVRRAALLTTQDSQVIKIDILKDKMVISKTNPNIGETREEIEMSYSGKEISVGFNPNYIMDVLKVIPKDELEIESMGNDKPAVIRIEDWCVYLLLPMQIA